MTDTRPKRLKCWLRDVDGFRVSFVAELQYIKLFESAVAVSEKIIDELFACRKFIPGDVYINARGDISICYSISAFHVSPYTVRLIIAPSNFAKSAVSLCDVDKLLQEYYTWLDREIES